METVMGKKRSPQRRQLHNASLSAGAGSPGILDYAGDCGLFRAVRAWRAKRKCHYEPNSLSDRSLKDIGLIRCEIESVIYGQSRQWLQRYGQAVGDLGINPTQSRQSRNSA
jgi:uncharacterized protein YjiS (DUF1127 family)